MHINCMIRDFFVGRLKAFDTRNVCAVENVPNDL